MIRDYTRPCACQCSTAMKWVILLFIMGGTIILGTLTGILIMHFTGYRGPGSTPPPAPTPHVLHGTYLLKYIFWVLSSVYDDDKGYHKLTLNESRLLRLSLVCATDPEHIPSHYYLTFNDIEFNQTLYLIDNNGIIDRSTSPSSVGLWRFYSIQSNIYNPFSNCLGSSYDKVPVDIQNVETLRYLDPKWASGMGARLTEQNTNLSWWWVDSSYF